MRAFHDLAKIILLLWSATSLAESCQDKVGTGGAYIYSHGVPIGNGMVECYVKARDGSGVPIKDSVAYDDVPATPEAAASGDHTGTSPQSKNPPLCPAKTYINSAGERIIESELARGTTSKAFQKQLFGVTQIGLPGWERAHSQGAGTGTESPEAIYYAPKEVNQEWQNCGIEDFLRDLVAITPENERLCLLTATTAHPNSLRLEEIQYKVTALKNDESTLRILEASITVQDKKKNPAVTGNVTYLHLPDSLKQGQPGTQPSRVELGFCRSKKK